MITIQERISDALTRLQNAVEGGKFGTDNRFNRDVFAAEFNDEVLIIAYVYENEIEKEEI